MRSTGIFLMVAALLIIHQQLTAQVAINPDGSAPHSSAMLDVSSTSRGFLVPRMSQAEKNAIASPATGLLVYQTDGTPGFYFYNGSSWMSQDQWKWSGADLFFSTGNVGIGNNAPGDLLAVGSSSQFQLNSSGNITKLNNITTSFPSVQGAAGSFLGNDGTGTLSWQVVPIIPSLTAGSVVFSGGGTTLSQNNAYFFWDNANARLALGANTFDATYPEKLKVNAGTTTSRTVIAGYGTINNQFQLLIKNGSAAPSASSELAAVANNGTTTNNYIYMGINSSAFSSASFTIGVANDAHVYNMGQNLSIGTGTAAKVIKFHTGGTLAANERMRIDGTGLVGINTTTPTSRLQVNGSVATAIVSKSANYTATASDYTIVCTAAPLTITLPAASGCSGRIYVIKKGVNNANLITINSLGGTIDGAASATFTTAYGIRILQSNGTNWFIIGRY
ncbi:MAG: hypothetical protein U0T82_06220 [Bacteroidales bacterium]